MAYPPEKKKAIHNGKNRLRQKHVYTVIYEYDERMQLIIVKETALSGFL